MNNSNIRLSIAALVVATGTGASFTAVAEQNWQGYTYAPAALSSYQGLEMLADMVRESTEGALSINVSPGGAMPINGSDIPQAIADGVLQFGATGGYSGFIPVGGIIRLPMIYKDEGELEIAYDVLEPYIAEALAEKNVKLLAHYRYPKQTVWSRSSMTGLSDLKDKRFRVVSPEQGEAVSRLGAAPVSMSTPDVASALQRGALDMVLTASAGGGKLWYEMIESNYRLGVSWAVGLVMANLESYNALDAETQAVLNHSAKKMGSWITHQFVLREAELTAQFKSEGLDVIYPSEEEEQAALEKVRPYWAEWADSKDARAKAALDSVLFALDKK